MPYTAGVLLLVAAVAVMIGVALQVSQYRRGRHIITRGQLITRLITAVLLMLAIGMIFYGVTRPWPVTPQGALAQLLYWSALMAVVIVVVLLALADLRKLERQRHLRQAELYRAIQELQDKTAGGRDGQ